MSSEILRLDWYSFLLGTQISAATGILASSPYRMNRIRFPREYLSPSFLNGGETIFLNRIKETGNCCNVLFQLGCRIVEKHIVGGCLYNLLHRALVRKNVSDENTARVLEFLNGGLLGLCFSLRYSGHTNISECILSSMLAAELTVSGEEIRRFLLEDGFVKAQAFEILLPYNKASFLSGAITGIVHGVCCRNANALVDQIDVPDFNLEDSSMECCMKMLHLSLQVCTLIFKISLYLLERSLVGGVLYCAFETLTMKISGSRNSIRVLPVPGLLLGLYLGANSDNLFHQRHNWRTLANVACNCRLLFFILNEIRAYYFKGAK